MFPFPENYVPPPCKNLMKRHNVIFSVVFTFEERSNTRSGLTRFRAADRREAIRSYRFLS